MAQQLWEVSGRILSATGGSLTVSGFEQQNKTQEKKARDWQSPTEQTLSGKPWQQSGHGRWRFVQAGSCVLSKPVQPTANLPCWFPVSSRPLQETFKCPLCRPEDLSTKLVLYAEPTISLYVIFTVKIKCWRKCYHKKTTNQISDFKTALIKSLYVLEKLNDQTVME